MTDEEFDSALVAAAFASAALVGWGDMSVASAARSTQLDLPRARARFPSKKAVLIKFGAQADRAALDGAEVTGQPPQEYLFDMLMRRIDVLQAHRAGMLALFRALPAEPHTALLLAIASRNSMRWMLEAAGLAGSGLGKQLHVQGLLGVWLWTVRAWRKDETADLAATMAALDTAVNRAAQFARAMPFQPVVAPPEPPPNRDPA